MTLERLLSARILTTALRLQAIRVARSYRRQWSMLYQRSRRNRRRDKGQARKRNRICEHYCQEHGCSHRCNIWPPYGQMDNP